MTEETEAVKIVARLMILAARTAPKAVGQDSIHCQVLAGKEKDRLAERILKMGKELGLTFFTINGRQVKASDTVVLIGVEGRKALELNCGGCGYAACAGMVKAQKERLEEPGTVYGGPNCMFKVSNLGIAVGSAVRTAAVHNVDNRIMFTAGVAALSLGLMKDCSIAYGIPLKAAGKNIFFDVPIHEK